MIGWRLLRELARANGPSIVLEAARCADPDYAVAAAAGGVALARVLGERVTCATDASVPGGAYGWPPEITGVVQAPSLEPLARERGVLYVTSDDELGAFLTAFGRMHGDLPHTKFAARFIDYAVMNALTYSDDHAAFVAVRRDRDLWVAVGDAGPGIAARSQWSGGLERSALEYETTRFDPEAERGLGKLAALWGGCVAVSAAEAVFASGDEMRTLTRTGTNDTVLGGAGPTVLSVRI